MNLIHRIKKWLEADIKKCENKKHKKSDKDDTNDIDNTAIKGYAVISTMIR